MGAIEGTTNFWTSVLIHSKLAIIVEHKLKAVEKLNTATINVLVLNPQLRACVDEANKMKSKKQLLLQNTEPNVLEIQIQIQIQMRRTR